MDSSVEIFTKGVHNLLSDEQIEQDAAQDSLGFFTQDGRIKLVPGRKVTGAEGTVGAIRALGFGFRNDGTLVLFRKNETKIQYKDASDVWQDVITGLTSGSEYTYANYVSLAGTFIIFTGVDGIFKIHTANPGSYISLYDATKNDKGKSIINKSRLIMWDCVNASKTTLKLSYIDAQDSTVYTTVNGESLGSGNGVLQTFTATLAFKASNPLANSFGMSFAAPIGTAKAVTGITQASSAVLHIVGHGYTVGQQIMVYGVVGMTQINNLVLTITAVGDADHVTVSTDSSGFTGYSSGGNAGVIELFTDNRNGLMTSPTGGTGTINYVTGAISVTFHGVPQNGSSIIGSYQWENSNSKGITDFTFSATRVASEGNRITQDYGGDPIVSVMVGQDGNYYSIKQQSSYKLAISTDDKTFDNNIFYANLGMPFFRAGVSSQKGIIFMNVSNPDKPEMTLLVKNAIGDALIPTIVFPHFKFSLYDYSDCSFDTYERYIIVACKKQGSASNDTVLLCNLEAGTVDPVPYAARMFAKDNSANLFIGSPVAQTVYQIFSGFDDDGDVIQNFWTSRGEKYSSLHLRTAKWRFIGQILKKFRKFKVMGLIDPNQWVEVYASYDNAGFQLIGTIRGDASYVDYSNPQSIGSNWIGKSQIGGDDITNAYPFFMELKVHPPKFRKRTIKLVAMGIGYFDVSFISDWDIMLFEARIPTRFRQKQKVSLDGKSVDQD